MITPYNARYTTLPIVIPAIFASYVLFKHLYPPFIRGNRFTKELRAYNFCEYSNGDATLSLLDDITDPSISTSNVLRKATMLAYQLKHQGFKDWLNWEINGYHHNAERWEHLVPLYRKVVAETYADVYGIGYRNPHTKVLFEESENKILHISQGVPSLEKLIGEGGSVAHVSWPPTQLLDMNTRVFGPQGTTAINVYYEFATLRIQEIIETVRDRLMYFLLDLKDEYPDLDKPGVSLPVIEADVNKVFQQTIGVNIHMSAFDQKGQNVHGNQYNAARDINFGSINNAGDIAPELEKLLMALQEAEGTEDEKIDAEAEIKKAVREVSSEQPQKSKVLGYLTNAKTLATSVTHLAGFAVLLEKAIQAVQTLMP